MGPPFSVEAVSRALGEQVASVGVVERFAASAAEVARLRVEGADRHSRTVIGKSATGAELAAARRERRFYEQLAPRWAHPAPALLGALEQGEGDGARLLLLTEDLEAAGYALPRGVRDDQIDALIDTLVRLHAAFWDDLGPAVDWAHPAPSVTQAAQAWPIDVIAANATAVRDAAARFAAAPELTADERALVPALVDPWERQFRARVALGGLTLIHADFHVLGNIFVAPNRPPRVIDWSELKPGLGPHDVAYLLTPLPAADRRARDAAVLRRYWDGLRAAGIDYAWELCAWDYRFSQFAKLFQSIFQGSVRWFRTSAALLEELDGRDALREPPPA